MGKIVVVSSVVYNLAGEEEKRPNYLKSLVVGNVIARKNKSVAQVIQAGYTASPGTRLRNFGKWARRSGYNNVMGMVSSGLVPGDSINMDLLAEAIPHGPAEKNIIQNAHIARNDVAFIAEEWILANRASDWNTAWVADYNPMNGLISVYFPRTNTSTAFAYPGYDPTARYLSVRYIVQTGARPISSTPGQLIEIGANEPFPSLAGWQMVRSIDPVNTAITLYTTRDMTATYSDGRPAEVTQTREPRTEFYGAIDGRYDRSVYDGQSGGGTQMTQDDYQRYMYQGVRLGSTVTNQTTTENIGGVTKTTQTQTTTEIITPYRQYKTDRQTTIRSSWSGVKILNYRFNSGNPTFDSMFGVPSNAGTFFPYIPLRINNVPLDQPNFPTLYPWAKKAFKKATGANQFQKTLENIQANPSIGDIDYAYASFGVSLNTKENASKKYIYAFLKTILGDAIDRGAYARWKLDKEQAKNIQNNWQAWNVAQGNPSDPLYGQPEPSMVPEPPLPEFFVQMTSAANASINYNMKITWSELSETTGSGQRRAGAKRGDLWWEFVEEQEFRSMLVNGVVGEGGLILDVPIVIPTMVLCWQETSTTWRSIKVINLKHHNFVYKGKSVGITAKEAFFDAEESGFIFPLHEDLYSEMSLIDQAQMATACCFLVFNCYVEKKKKWYQSGWFQVVLIIVVIVIAVFSGGTGAAAGGVLGSNAAVGAALGFTATTALIVGAAANAIAAMILMQVIGQVSTAAFGEKWGAVIGTIAGIAAISVGTSIQSGANWSAGFGEMIKAENLIKLSSSVGNGYSEFLKAGTQETLAKTQALEQSYNESSLKIQSAYADNVGYDRGAINPLSFTESVQQMGLTPESVDSFLSRTLMTGDDIVELSQQMLNNFTDITLNTDLPL